MCPTYVQKHTKLKIHEQEIIYPRFSRNRFVGNRRLRTAESREACRQRTSEHSVDYRRGHDARPRLLRLPRSQDAEHRPSGGGGRDVHQRTLLRSAQFADPFGDAHRTAPHDYGFAQPSQQPRQGTAGFHQTVHLLSARGGLHLHTRRPRLFRESEQHHQRP